MKRVFYSLILGFLFLNSSVFALSASGEFKAQKECQLYVSKNKRTNPDNAVTAVGQSYNIFEVNVAEGTTWFRIEDEKADPKERWVYFECGSADVKVGNGSGGGSSSAKSGGSCDIAGQEDSYVFALSWQPAFCEGHASKPECKVSDPKSFQANNFTLHGLWPNKNSCGTKYGFCGEYKKPLKAFCDYKKIAMSETTFQSLEIVMPSAAYGSCLQRHEWYKHGTCQTEWGADGYFDEAMRLLEEFNKEIADVMNKNIGKTIQTKTLFNEVDKAFGADAHKRLMISCYKGNLVDIYIALPAQLEGKGLKALMQEADESFRNKCGDSFTVDAIGQ